MTQGGTLGATAARAALWSGLGGITLRLGSFVVGIVLARILAPEQFGVFAIALTVQAILMTVADLGLSADLIRSDDPMRIAPTVATLGLVSGGLLTLATLVWSGQIAELLGSSAAASAIAVLSVSLVLGGVTVVPFAMLQRRFQQRELFVVFAVDFVVSTAVTLSLVGLGFGVLALAIGRVSAQVVSTVLQFVFARVVPRFGVDRTVVRPVLAFGVPIAAANLLSWALLNADNVILARVLGATALGFYVLAFNISNWPMSALASVVRSISLPYFSRAESTTDALAVVTALAWALALPAGGVLAVLSDPVISVVYGDKWLPAAPVLAALGVYGALRVVFDVFAGFLYARGLSRPVLWIQVVWLVAIVGAVLAGAQTLGIAGAGWAHAIVAVVVVLPAYLLVLRRAGLQIVPLLRETARPTIAAAAAILVAFGLRMLFAEPVAALLVAGGGALLTYAVLAGPWVYRRFRGARGGPTARPAENAVSGRG
ncbi:oligosaccharide flippase family protein [Microbacterium sp. 179-B 1A2 NHS]|uniref:oligosaccharide flippase family protein n=1 Tax=Microbacterium sp. 179-B 1A2 NHS TaxID=3142383 RepID=UPI0039A0FB49